MKTHVAIPFVVIFFAVGLGIGFKTALIREHHQLEQNKKLLRRVHKEVWSNPDLNAAMKAADELYTPDFVLHDWTGDSYGVNNVKKGVTETRASFPDSREEVLDIVAERNMVMTRFMSSGTQKGDIPAIPGYQPVVPPNGKFQRFPELAVHRIVEGKIAEQWDFSDGWGANIQAGLIDPSNWTASVICRSDAGGSDPRFKSVSNSRSQLEPGPAASTRLPLDLFFIAKEKQVWEALKNKDKAAVTRLIADDFVGMYDFGFFTKPEWIKQIDGQYTVDDYTIGDPRVLHPSSTTALLLYKSTCKGTGEWAEFCSHTQRISDLWVERNGQWMDLFSQDTQAASSQDDDKAVLAAILESENQIVGTLQRNDIGAFAKMLPEDIVDIEDDGIHTKSEWLKEIQKQKNDGYLFKDFRFEDPRLIRLGPEAAIMFGKEIWHAIDKGRLVEVHLYTHALYVRRAGKWVPRFYQDTIAQNSN
jgi:predicted ester cyclase